MTIFHVIKYHSDKMSLSVINNLPQPIFDKWVDKLRRIDREFGSRLLPATIRMKVLKEVLLEYDDDI
jgi:hypothetical protein